jgi:hypothetical protein
MRRSEFLKKVVRYILFGSLALIAFLTGSRVVSGSECTACPGKGICKGESDCSIFLSDRK